MLTPLFAWLGSIHQLLPLLIAVGALGACAGIFGCFTLLRKQSLFGDTMAHASLPGIALVFMLTQTTNPFLLLLGGSSTSLLGALLVHSMQKKTRLKIDAILGCILSFFFGLGLLLMSIIQRSYSAQQAILGKFLFGNAALLLDSDLSALFLISILLISVIILCYKEITCFTFDATFMHALGYSTQNLNIFFILLLVILIGISMQTVGTLLITTLLIAPAAAARQWTYHFHIMLFLSACFGAFSTIIGTLISYHCQSLPTGPSMIATATILACTSLFKKSLYSYS